MLAHMRHHCSWASFSRLQLINTFKPFTRIVQQKSHLCDESKNRPNLHNTAINKPKKNPNISPNVETRYDVFTDDSATIILDVEEEREKMFNKNESATNKDGKWSIPGHISKERKRFDIELILTNINSMVFV